MKIIKFILKHPAGTLMLCITLSAGGLWSLTEMRIDYLPDFTVPELTVSAAYPGLPAGDIRQLITIPLENSLSSLSGLRKISSISKDNTCIINLEFTWGIDRTAAAINTRAMIDIAWQNLPEDAPKPQVLPVNPGDIPIMTLGVFPKNRGLSLTRRLADREIRSMLQRVKGVGLIQVTGGFIEEVQIMTDTEAASRQGFTLSEIGKAISCSNIELPAGSITVGSKDFTVKTSSRVSTLSDLQEMYISHIGGTEENTARLRDFSQIMLGTEEQNSFFYLADENETVEGVQIQVRNIAGYSPVQTAENLRIRIEEINRSFRNDIEVRIISDRSIILKKSIKDLTIALVSGAVCAFFVIILFLKNLQQAVIMLISLPLSLLTAVLLLNLAGRSLNLMSIGGLALGVGMVVDNAIIMTERLSRQVPPEAENLQRIDSISEIVTELRSPLAGSTATTVLVFTPLLLIDGMAGSLFGDLGLSVILALASSLLIALTAIPVVYLKLNPPRLKPSGGSRISRLLRKLIRWGLSKPAHVIPIVVICSAIGFFPISKLPLQVIPTINEGIINCSARMPPGTNIKTIKLISYELINKLLKVTDADRIFAWSGGSPDDPYYLSSVNESAHEIQIRIILKPGCSIAQQTAALSSQLVLNDGAFLLNKPDNIIENLLGLQSNGEWAIGGNNPSEIRTRSAEIIKALDDASESGSSGAEQVPVDMKTILKLYPDRKALTACGLKLSDIVSQLSLALYGTIPAQIELNGRHIDVRLRAAENLRNSRKDLLSFSIPNNDSVLVRAGTVLKLKEEKTIPFLLRENRKDIALIRLSGNTKDKYSKILLSAGARVYGSSAMSDQTRELIMTAILAIVLLYLCLGIQFESFTVPLMLMLSIPAGAAGISSALFLCSESINLYSCLGILVVMGISVNNGILLYEESIQRMKHKHAVPAGAAYSAAVSRTRPIMMTSLTTITALIPLAAAPAGSSVQSPLSVAVIGGICASSLISIIILPAMIKYRLGHLR